ncbi:MAG: GntR family transcriptional regulator, partial [Parvibaculum sp.]
MEQKVIPLPGQAGTVVETTIQAMRDAILDGTFLPGQRLVVADLQQRYGISAGPVREAIRRLTGEGLVDVLPHRGAVVRRFSERDVREYFEVREGLDGVAARLAAGNIHRGDYRDRLAALIEEFRIAAGAGGPELLAIRGALRDLIFEIAGNMRLAEIASRLVYPALSERLHKLLPKRTASSFSEYEKVVKAIMEGDGLEAERLMRLHLR